MLDSLPVRSVTSQYGCGIYEVGTESFRMFITDGGRVLPVQGRAITADDLITAYVWGRIEQRIAYTPSSSKGFDFGERKDE
jgi:hypothetical protein